MPFIVYILLALLSIIWGASFYFIKILVDAFNPWAVTLIRCASGAFILLFWLFFKKLWHHVGNIPWLKLGIIGIINSSLPWTLIAFSETQLTSSLTSVLNAFSPIWTLIVGVLFFQSKSSSFQWIGVVFGFAGIFILSDFQWGTDADSTWLGFGAMMLTTFCYAWGAHFSKKYLQDVPVEWIAFVTLLGGILFSGLGMLATGQGIDAQMFIAPSVLLAVVGLGVFGSGIAYLLYYTILQKGTAEFVVLVTYLVPVFAIFWGVFLLDEPLEWKLFIGLILILSGVYLSGKRKRKNVAS